MTPSAAPQQSQSRSTSASALMEGLQPTLRNAMSSLNINLDYELARYRFAKRKGAQPGVAPPKFQPQLRSLNLINVPAQRPPAPPVTSAVKPPPPPPNPRLAQTATVPNAGDLSDPAVSVSGSPSEVAALRSALVRQPAPPSEEYLASSEALLEDFNAHYYAATPETRVQPPSKSWFQNWNTPLGLGALMLLLVTSAGFGFVLVNPYVAKNLVSHTPLARLWPTPAEDEAVTDEATAANPEATAELDGPPLSSMSPDLSQQEFSDLDLNTLSNLPANSTSPAPDASGRNPGESDEAAATPNRSAPTNPGAVAAGAAPRVPQVVNEMPRTTTPVPQPAPAAPAYQQPYEESAPAPAPQPAPAPVAGPQPSATPAAESGSGRSEPASSYYVVTDYTGDPSLNSAREAVGDAYVRNFDDGARIQLGAFNSQEGAATLAEELKNQGIDAQIYEP